MAADEEQSQYVVAIVGIVEPRGDLLLGIVEIGQCLFVGQRLVARAAAHRVDGGIASDEDQPGDGIARRPVLRPCLQCPEAGVLECLLGRVEVTEIAQQGGHRARSRGAQCLADPFHVCHAGNVQGWKIPMGRIS